MNSFATREETLAALERYPEHARPTCPSTSFRARCPSSAPTISQPVELAGRIPSSSGRPPGHGDLYTALVTSGMLRALLDAGYRYAFVSNSDNLGAVLEPRILAWFAREELPFLMEVADRTEADRKGGHLAPRPGRRPGPARERADPGRGHGRLPGRHAPPLLQHQHAVGQPARARGRLDARDGFLGLPMIANRKTVDPSDNVVPEVIQVETAMGAAIGVFDGAQACACRGAGSLRSRPPTTCSRCAPTPTC